jgi:glutamate-1-semialdehyde aminotransferase
MTEPVQGGDPSYLPREFLKRLRDVTERNDIALIFDEIVTGFRTHPGGIQGLIGVKADIATYGKVCGGGMPIGIVAGCSKYMDSLDGGEWQFGDDSRPEANMTFFAGTFMRHPLALAACVAVLEHLKQEGPKLQSDLNNKMSGFAEKLNRIFEHAGVPMKLNHFSSLSRIEATQEMPYAGLLYYLLREKGIHIWEGRAVILTTAHSDDDIQHVLRAFEEAIAELQSVDLLPGIAKSDFSPVDELPTSMEMQNGASASRMAPVQGALLGRTAEGFPAWFVKNPEAPGEYLQVGEHLTSE